MCVCKVRKDSPPDTHTHTTHTHTDSHTHTRTHTGRSREGGRERRERDERERGKKKSPGLIYAQKRDNPEVPAVFEPSTKSSFQIFPQITSTFLVLYRARTKSSASTGPQTLVFCPFWSSMR